LLETLLVAGAAPATLLVALLAFLLFVFAGAFFFAAFALSGALFFAVFALSGALFFAPFFATDLDFVFVFFIWILSVRGAREAYPV
jgi:hypothetical protein